MADLPSIRTKEQIIRDITYGLIARNPSLNDFNSGSVISQFIEAVAQSQFKSYADIIGMVDALSVDRAVGEALQRLAADKNVPILPARASIGKVKITDSSIQKISSFIYYGQPAPVAGSLVFYIVDGSKANPSGGQLYIGRGTTNQEGPLNYTSVVPQAGGSYYKVTLAATSPTTRFHNTGEGVVFAQGGTRLIPVGTELRTSRDSSAEPISFLTTAAATIIDGETTVFDVPVASKESGAKYNVPKGAIKDIIGLSFSATVSNEFATSNGRDADTDDDIRQRIKDYEKAKSKGTESAVRLASLNARDSVEQKTVVSTNILKYTDNSAALIFDDGTGYEPLYFGASFETVVDEAFGGEQEIQLRKKPLAQARVRCVNDSPYNIADLSVISVEINGVQTQHQFKSSDFRVPSSATAYEVASSINANPSINFSATTSLNGTRVVLHPRDKDDNTIIVKKTTSAVDVNDILGFPNTEDVTLRIYKNDSPLRLDGTQAKISTMNKGLWLSSIAPGDTLKYKVDGTQELSLVFTNTDFQSIDVSSIMSVNTSIDIWAKVFDSKMPGVDANVNGEVIDFTSNRGFSNLAKLEFTGGSLLSKIFDPDADLSKTGSAPDYTLNKQTGQIGLFAPLLPGDKITAGSQFTRASVQTRSIESGPSVNGRIWMIVDGSVDPVPNGLNANSFVSFEKVSEKLIINCESALSVPEGFEEARAGDWVLVWANPTDSASLQNNQGFWKIESVEVGKITVNTGTFGTTTAPFVPLTNRIKIVRSEAPIQLLDFTVGTLNNFADEINQKIVGIDAEVVGSTVRISTKTFGDNGEIYIIAADQNGETLQLPIGDVKTNISSHYGFTVTSDSEAGFPSFTHTRLGAASSDTEFTDNNYLKLGGKNGSFIELLSDYDTSSSPKIIPDSNQKRRAFVSDYESSTSTLTLDPKRFMKIGGSLIQGDDRYFIRSSYSFDPNDNVTLVVDNDNFTKSFSLPVSRKIKVSSHSTPSNQDFSASDAQSSLALNDPISFYGFDFKAFKLLRQSHRTLTNGDYAVKFKSYDFGKIGDTYRVGFIYPTSGVQSPLSHKIEISDVLDVGIVLPVTEVRTPTWDYTSAFTVSKSTSGAKDILTYVYRVGTEIDLTSTGSSVNIGDLALIGGSSSLLAGNKNIKGKITNVSATEFTIELPAGSTEDDNIEFTDMINDGTATTITTDLPHQLKIGDQIGIWGSQSSDGVAIPFDTTYIVSSVDSTTQFKVATPSTVPGGTISYAVLPINSNIVTVTTAEPHELTVGNVVRINTGNSNIDGLSSVFNIINANQFQVTKPGSALTSYSVTSGRFDFQSYKSSGSTAISTISKTGTVVTVNTTTPHGLSPNDLVQVSTVSIGHWSASATYSNNQIVRYGTQNYVSIGTNSPEVSTSGTGTLGNSEITLSSVTGITAGMGVAHASVPEGTVVMSVDTINSKVLLNNALTGNITAEVVYFSQIPSDLLDIKWSLSDLDLTGNFVVNLVPSSTSFTYYYYQSGSASGTGGSASPLVSAGALARCLNLTENLSIVKVETTAQEVVDYVSANLSEKILASLANANSSAVIDTSTEDLAVSTDYISANITALEKSVGSRLVRLTCDTEVLPGSTIKLDWGSEYDGKYVVLKTEVSGSDYILDIHTSVVASESDIVMVSETIIGSSPYLMLEDGENFVESTDLGSLIGSPQFYAKNQWKESLSIDEELVLMAVNAEQLVRFWNKPVVTGLSNSALIENSEYGRQIQISTRTFGNTGSIRVTGGTGNAVTMALSGSSTELNSKQGLLFVPVEIKKGLVDGQWIKVQNQIRQNKIINFGIGTTLRTYNDGLEITSSVPSTGTFQTERLLSHTEDTVVKIERHGEFVALISVGGPSFGIATAGVQEGDWLRIKNVDASAWSLSSTYSIGDRVKYNGFNYTSLQNSNTGNIPEDEPDYWEIREFSQTNEGVHQVVRTFGEDTVWIKYDNALEGLHYIGDAGNIKAYSYDSVMPGDTLVITTNVLGVQNSGRYAVVDEDEGLGYYFPAANRIYTKPIQSATGPTVLGGEFSQVNIEEKDPIVLWKKTFTVGPASNFLAAVLTDSPNLMNRVGESLGSYIEGQGKIAFDTNINFGVDAYKYYEGLIRELNRIIYGDSSDSYNYPGVRAAGTDIDIKPATAKRIKISLAVRVRSGTPFSQIREKIKAVVAANINELGAGEQVSISKCIAAASTVSGVTSVAVTAPVYDAANDLITVAPSEKPLVLDPTTDIIVSLID